MTTRKSSNAIMISHRRCSGFNSIAESIQFYLLLKQIEASWVGLESYDAAAIANMFRKRNRIQADVRTYINNNVSRTNLRHDSRPRFRFIRFWNSAQLRQ